MEEKVRQQREIEKKWKWDSGREESEVGQGNGGESETKWDRGENGVRW